MCGVLHCIQSRTHEMRCLHACCVSALTPVAFSQLHDFIFVPLNVSWSEAQAFCREHYTDLATVDDKEDNDNLLKVLANVSSAWIGLHRTSSASPLIWSDQSGSTFSDWAAGQPNNYAGIQWCVNILYNKWSDQECFIKVPFVCYFGELILLTNIHKNVFL